ncbi:hypothetical protein EJ02DRAFT_166540 [Clathrospora elynae]|uniref:Uncharacterized protein n=1 Tax=Clathrospora elynae TaxID=706981 RepID=A0A6A5SVE4_9PLEO|nr:hypothetical protein EJ02DRAFT_166540 [Clathrospora elynae]
MKPIAIYKVDISLPFMGIGMTCGGLPTYRSGPLASVETTATAWKARKGEERCCTIATRVYFIDFHPAYYSCVLGCAFLGSPRSLILLCRYAAEQSLNRLFEDTANQHICHSYNIGCCLARLSLVKQRSWFATLVPEHRRHIQHLPVLCPLTTFRSRLVTVLTSFLRLARDRRELL